MSRHATALALSSYLDDELDAGSSARLEAHLENCAGCRDRLSSMRRLTTELATLTPHVPPSALASDLENRLRGLERSTPWLERFEGSLKGWSLQSALVPLFATLVAIGFIVVLLAQGLSPGSDVDWTRAEPGAAESGGAVEPGGTVVRRVVGDRVFEERGAIWFELGEMGEPSRVLDLRGQTVPAELTEAADIGSTVQLRLDGERVRVLFRD